MKEYESGISTVKENVHVRINILGSPLESPGLFLTSPIYSILAHSNSWLQNLNWVNLELHTLRGDRTCRLMLNT